MSADTVADESPGLYGKLPARGDFIQRGSLPRDFLDAWDEWLQGSLAQSRERLGESWLRGYLNSPVWRFALSAGCCGKQPVAGLLMPSVDRVGRYFPLTLALPLADGADLAALTQTAADWFEQAEQLLLEALADDLDLDRFTDRVRALGVPRYPSSPVVVEGRHWYCELEGLEDLSAQWLRLQPMLLNQAFPRYCLWWSHGSHQINPCLLITAGLPPETAFAALLMGDWAGHDWGIIASPASRPAIAGPP